MIKKAINPWTWQEQFNFSQAWRVDEPRSLVFVSGQASVSKEGNVLHEHDFAAQARQSLSNLEVVLRAAGVTLEDIVKMTIFLTDRDNFSVYKQIHGEVFSGQKPADTVLVVSSLALPELLVEIEAIAVL